MPLITLKHNRSESNSTSASSSSNLKPKGTGIVKNIDHAKNVRSGQKAAAIAAVVVIAVIGIIYAIVFMADAIDLLKKNWQQIFQIFSGI